MYSRLSEPMIYLFIVLDPCQPINNLYVGHHGIKDFNQLYFFIQLIIILWFVY